MKKTKKMKIKLDKVDEYAIRFIREMHHINSNNSAIRFALRTIVANEDNAHKISKGIRDTYKDGDRAPRVEVEINENTGKAVGYYDLPDDYPDRGYYDEDGKFIP